LYNTSFKQICNWVHQFESEGIEGLKNKPKPGRTSRLTQAQKDELKFVLLNNSPEEYDYNTSTWNGPIIIDYIDKKYHIKYKKAQIYNILKDMGLSFQKGRPSYPEADEKKREEFITRLKKTKRGT
jgi:transposase